MYRIIISLVLLSFAGACRKALPDINDYFPAVKTLSATVQADGTVLVEGQLVSEGAAPVQYAGFCCGTGQRPHITERQLIAENVTDGKFTAVYSGFNPDSTYYFRTWATNEYGYAYGDSVSLSGISATPVDPPCSMSLNSCSPGGFQPLAYFDEVSVVSRSVSGWELTASSSSGPLVKFTFGSALATGVFQTVDYTSPESGQVFVRFYSGFIQSALNAGSKVYVHALGSGVYDIAICDAPWQWNGSGNYYFSARLKTPT